MAPHPDHTKEEPVQDTLENPDTTAITALRRIADFDPTVSEQLEAEIAAYNDGRPLNINAMADLFGVNKYTIYAWCPAEGAPQPSTEYLPAPLTTVPTREWNPEEAIRWGLMVGKLDWTNPGFARRNLRRLQSPGRNRRHGVTAA